MLEKIEYIFPKNNKNIELFDLLFTLFKDLQYVTVDDEGQQINIISSTLHPKTVFRIDNNISDIQFSIGNDEYLNFLNRNSDCTESKELTGIKKLSIGDVKSKLKGHIKRIDHTGINLPSSLYSKLEWNNMLKYLSSVSNLYSYPTGDPWPFLLPSTIEENQNEITNFEIIREPRFELVYDHYTDIVAIQIDIETDLSKSEVESLFPKNQGIYFNCLEDHFKTIYLNYCEYLDIRFDIRFKCSHDDFESGEWFVSKGKRLKMD